MIYVRTLRRKKLIEHMLGRVEKVEPDQFRPRKTAPDTRRVRELAFLPLMMPNEKVSCSAEAESLHEDFLRTLKDICHLQGLPSHEAHQCLQIASIVKAPLEGLPATPLRPAFATSIKGRGSWPQIAVD